MKYLLIALFFSTASEAQLPKGLAGVVKEKSSKVLSECKDDKAKIKACDSYTEATVLRVCLLKNKDALSDKCKKALSL